MNNTTASLAARKAMELQQLVADRTLLASNPAAELSTISFNFTSAHVRVSSAHLAAMQVVVLAELDRQIADLKQELTTLLT